LYAVAHDEFLYVVSKTYSALKSAGFKLIKSEEIQRNLDLLYEVYFPRVQMATSIEPDIQAYFSDYIKNNFKAVSADTLYNSGINIKELTSSELFNAGRRSILNYIPIDYAHFKNDPEFRLLLENSIRWRMMKIFRYKNAMADTEETIDLIEEYLSGKVKFPQNQ
jgi:hypothetical protein